MIKKKIGLRDKVGFFIFGVAIYGAGLVIRMAASVIEFFKKPNRIENRTIILEKKYENS